MSFQFKSFAAASISSVLAFAILMPAFVSEVSASPLPVATALAKDRSVAAEGARLTDVRYRRHAGRRRGYARNYGLGGGAAVLGVLGLGIAAIAAQERGNRRDDDFYYNPGYNPGYYPQPSPVYVQPQPGYYQQPDYDYYQPPRQVYIQPRPVHQPRPVYQQPQVYQQQRPAYQPPRAAYQPQVPAFFQPPRQAFVPPARPYGQHGHHRLPPGFPQQPGWH